MKPLLLFLLIPVLLAFSGCTLLRESESSSKEKLLVASGFQARPAATASQQASLAAMKPYKIQMRAKSGAVYYTYADPKANTLYIGGAKEYTAYKKLAVQQDTLDQEEMLATEANMSPFDWGMWSPWVW